jgi:hypothetical protein
MGDDVDEGGYVGDMGWKLRVRVRLDDEGGSLGRGWRRGGDLQEGGDGWEVRMKGGVDSTGVRIRWGAVSSSIGILTCKVQQCSAVAAASRCFISNLWFAGRDARPCKWRGWAWKGCGKLLGGWARNRLGIIRRDLPDGCTVTPSPASHTESEPRHQVLALAQRS